MTSHGCHDVSNHRQVDCLSSSFNLTPKRTSKRCISGPFVMGVHRRTVHALHKGPVIRRAFPFLISWRHHESSAWLVEGEDYIFWHHTIGWKIFFSIASRGLKDGIWIKCKNNISGNPHCNDHVIMYVCLNVSRCRDHSGYGLSQWQKALYSNAFSHWQSP